jgi:hypothetical protein
METSAAAPPVRIEKLVNSSELVGHSRLQGPERERVGGSARAVENPASRIFRAPPERVFRLFTDTATIPYVLAPYPRSVTIEKLDFRKGGHYSFLVKMDDGSSIPWRVPRNRSSPAGDQHVRSRCVPQSLRCRDGPLRAGRGLHPHDCPLDVSAVGRPGQDGGTRDERGRHDHLGERRGTPREGMARSYRAPSIGEGRWRERSPPIYT